MPMRWSQSRFWSAYSATASNLLFVSRPSKKIVEKTHRTRPSRRLSWLRPKPPWTFLCRPMKWMLPALKATAPPQNLPRIIPGTKTPFCSAPKRHKPCLFIVSSELRPWRDHAKTIRRVGTIRIVAITAPAASGLRALPRPLESTWPRLRLEIIVAATS